VVEEVELVILYPLIEVVRQEQVVVVEEVDLHIVQDKQEQPILVVVEVVEHEEVVHILEVVVVLEL
tara:strand:- start:86 stop:283 length:198 start_codon:yes stop_codon:yes gene_type:complete